MQEQPATTQSHSARPLVIPVFIPNAGCPHRCIYCNQVTVTGQAAELPSTGALHAQIGRYLSYRIRNRHPIEIAFFGGNFLGLDTPSIKSLLKEAGRYVEAGKVDGLRFSTRPDTLNRKKIDLLEPFPVTTIEIGAQSMVDSVLKRSKRGHTAADTTHAVKLLKSTGYNIGLQLMVGLPAETRADLETTGQAAVKLAPDFVRIYPTLVLAGSPLASAYRQERFYPIDLDEAVWRSKALYRLFHAAGIGIIRMGLQASADLQQPSQVLAGPFHPAFGHLVFSALFLDAASKAIASAGFNSRHIVLRVNPRSESKMRGLRNHNMDILKSRFNLSSLIIETEADLSEQQIGLNNLIIDAMTTQNPIEQENAEI